MSYIFVRIPFCGIAALLVGGLVALTPPPAHAGWTLDGNPVTATLSFQQAPVVVSDGHGGATVVWTDFRSGGGDIYAQRLDANGTPLWSANGVAVCADTRNQSAPTAARSGSGAVVAWLDDRAPTDTNHIYAQRLDGSGVPQWTPNGVLLATNRADVANPRIMSDLSSPLVALPGFYVAYDVLSPVREVWAQRVDVSGAGLWSPGTSGGVRVSLFGGASFRQLTGLTSDGGSALALLVGFVAVWTDQATLSSAPDVMVNRVNSSGVQQWGTGVSVSPLAVRQSEGSVAQVGTQTTIVAWKDERNADADIYAQRIDGTGARIWLSDGLPVCRASGVQSNPLTVASSAGTAIVVWRDGRSGTTRLYAQRLDANGQPQWGVVPDGIALCDVDVPQTSQQAISDGAGGVIVVWVDHRGATSDIYAQRVDVNGNRLWGSNGVPVSAFTADQTVPQLTTDSSAGAIVAWQDARNAGQACYAVRSFNDVNVSAAPEPGAIGARLELVSRNPGPGPVLLSLDLPADEIVSAAVFDVRGRRVDTLGADAPWAAGPHRLQWDGHDADGRDTPRGIYFVRVQAGGRSDSIKVTKID